MSAIELKTVVVSCMIDQVPQRCRVLRAGDDPRPLLVYLHTWGGTFEQSADEAIAECAARGWHFIQPDFRGPNHRPEACGSRLARQDVIDALDWAMRELRVDADRVYVMGGSGGGHMTMMMAARFADRFAAASAWCGISDLAAWHRECEPQPRFSKYARDIEACVGGRPGDSARVDEELHDRSPLHHMAGAAKLPLDLNHGVHDGKTGSVPFRHTIDAFNILAAVHKVPPVAADEVRQLDQHGRLDNPSPADTAPDPLYNRAIHLRRHAGPTRLTIFEGGHEIFTAAACAWLARHHRGVQGKAASAPFAQARRVSSTQIAG